jgi:XisH protein
MSARDRFHNSVRHALEKDGWTITDDPLRFNFADASVLLDLGAERLIGLSRNNELIAVEIKGASGPSRMSDFHATVGQYRNYQAALELRQPDRVLYLAVPQSLFETFYQNELVRYSLERNHVSVLVYDPEKEVILEWHKSN